MTKFSVDGIIIKSSVTGEADRIVWVLTRNRGIIRAFAKGARGTKNRLHSGTALFSYCNFVFYEKNNVYNVNEAEMIEMFYDLRNGLEKLTLAQYFCEVMLKTLPEENDEEIYLRLLLNSLYFLCKGNKDEKLVKAVFELKTAAVSGYMPSLVGCDNCGEYKTDIMYFNTGSGKLYCSECGKDLDIQAVPYPVIEAMRHICYSEFNNIFSFELSEELLVFLNEITERYLSLCFGQNFKLLSYYKEIKE